MTNMLNGASVAVIRNDGAVLLQLRDNIANINYPNHWCLPGGQVGKGEDFKEAAKRELKEETDYDAESLKLLTEEIYINDKGEKIKRHVYWTRYDGEQKTKCLEGQDLKFVHPKEFNKLRFLPGHKKICQIAVLLASKRN